MVDSLGETTFNFVENLDIKFKNHKTIMDLLLVWDLLNTI